MTLRSYLRQRWPELLRRLNLPKALRNVPNYALVRCLQECSIWPEAAGYNPATQTYSVGDPPMRVRVRGGEREIEIDGVAVSIETATDYDIAREVLIPTESDYQWLFDLKTPDERGVVVWDVGANFGAVSVLFARRENVVAVYGYEPFQHTFECYKRTIALNPEQAAIIHPHQYGIAGRNQDVILSYVKKVKSDNGLYSLDASHKKRLRLAQRDLTVENVHFADASEVIATIRAAHPNALLLAKIDCEGAEYEIFDRLIETGTVVLLHAATIECHSGDAQELARRLESAGFATSLTRKMPTVYLLDIQRKDA